MSTQHPAQPPPDDPHVGSEDDPRREPDPHDEVTVVPPRRYEASTVEPAADVTRIRSQPTVADRLVAASGPLALISFFLIGFSTGRWYIAWVVFLVPAVLRAWNRP
jgi:hypothetical protein